MNQAPWRVGEKATVYSREMLEGRRREPRAGVVRIEHIPPPEVFERDPYLGVRSLTNIVDWNHELPIVVRGVGERFLVHVAHLRRIGEDV